jgi:Family of unknown function (DUF6348)
MPSLFDHIKFTWEYFVRGLHRIPPVSAPPDFDYPSPDPRLMEFLSGMYQEHGALAVRVGNWICVDGGRVLTRASHFDHPSPSKNLVIQADFVTLTVDGQHIVESLAGIGPDRSTAIEDACEGFQGSCFHALFVTLLDHPCDHVDRETWIIGGQARQVTFGWLRTRGAFPFDRWPPVFERIQGHMKSLPLSPGRHWIRYFYCHLPSGAPTVEVLVDNETHEELQARGGGLPWPASDTVYSVRLFFVIQDG